MGLFTKKAEEAVDQSMPVSSPSPSIPPFSMEQLPFGGGMDYANTQLAEYLASNKDLIEQIKATFRGKIVNEEFDENTGTIKKVERSVGEPLVNELGLQRIIGYIESMVFRNSILSNLEKEFISNLMIEVNDRLTIEVLDNQERYGIREKDVLRIIDESENLIYICLTRGLERGEANLAYKGRRENITRYIDEAGQAAINAQNRGLFGFMR